MSKVLLAVQLLLVVADEALQCSILMLTCLAVAAPQRLVQRVVLPEVGIGAVVPCAGIDVGVVVTVGADDQRAGATWWGKE